SAVPAVANGTHLAFADRDLEFELGINGIRVSLSQVETQAGAAKHGPGSSAIDGQIEWQHSDVGRAIDKDLVVDQQLLEFTKLGFEICNEVAALVFEADGKIIKEPADPDV